MSSISKFVVTAAFALACAACSQQPATTSAPAGAIASAAPPASAIPLTAPGASAATPRAATAPGPSLAEMLKRPGFARAFDAMDGASTLPAWAKGAGAATPSQHVEVGGKSMLLAHVCESTDCNDGQLFVLVDPADHVLQGVLVQSSGSAGASVQQLAWLGKPGPDAQAYLKGQAAHE